MQTARSVSVDSETKTTTETAEIEDDRPPQDERWTAQQTKATKSYIYRFGVALPATLLCSYLVYGEGVGKSGIFLAMDLAWTTITYYWFELWWDVWSPREQAVATAAFFGGTVMAMFIRANYYDQIMELIHHVI